MVWISDPLPEEGAGLEIPVRREHEEGTLGKPIKLVTNYFKVEFRKKDDKNVIYHYDIKISEISKIQEDELCDSSTNNVPVSVPHASGSSKPSTVKKMKKKKPEKTITKDISADPKMENNSVSSSGAGRMPEASPKFISKALRRKIFKAFVECSKVFDSHIMAYDGGNSAYSVSQLSAPRDRSGDTFQFEDPEGNFRRRQYRLEWKLVEFIELKKLLSHLGMQKHLPKHCQTIFHGLEVMFNYERTQRFATASFNRFFSHDEKIFGSNFGIGRGKEGVHGFFMSLRPCQGWKDAGALMLNLDVSHAVFYKSQSVLDYLRTLPNGSKLFSNPNLPLHPYAIQLINEEIIKKKIKVEIMKTKQIYKRKYQVAEVSCKNPEIHTFEREKGNPASRCSVAEHFRQAHGVELEYPKLNCFIMSNKAYVPIEVCQIVAGQLAKERLRSGNESRDFIKHTTVRPDVRQKQIQKIFKENKFNEDPVLKDLGVSIESSMVSVDGRVLPAPVVKLSETVNRDVNNGVWTMKLEEKFDSPSQLNFWGILNFSSDDDAFEKMRELEERLFCVAEMKGMNPQKSSFLEDFCKKKKKTTQLATNLQELKKSYPGLQVIFFIIGEKDQHIYDQMKSMCDGDLSVATQCVRSSTLKRQSDLLMTNILLKVNAKLGKVSHMASYEGESYVMYKELFDAPVMVMGADVNHPMAGDATMPSMVAVMASVDEWASRYVHEVRHQTTRRDVIEDMQEITQNLLEQFESVSNCRPARIIMYRDGVSDTQFTTVLACELKAMRDACAAFGEDYKPPMTFICVQKRHHTRFFCAEKSDADRSGNVPPGTVVDSVIASHSNRNFFLCSHAGVMGTSRPSHYTVLWDDSDLTMDQLQLLTYSLCHNYVRCFRAVSMPSPVFYADRAAYRAKTRLEGEILQDPDKWRNALFTSKDGKYPEEWLRKAVRVDKDMEASKKMYYV